MALVFSVTQQQALVGHTFSDPLIWEQLDEIGTSAEWLNDPALRELFTQIEKYRKKHRRPPNAFELKDFVETTDAQVAKSISQTILECGRAARGLGLEPILENLQSWHKERILVRRVHQIRDEFQSQGIDAAIKVAETMMVDIQRVAAISGFHPDHLESMSTRVGEEHLERQKEVGNYVQYGISYLDDALGGMSQSDLVVLGAKAGRGKSQILTNIAKFNALAGKKVAFFALEAEHYEIERRIKYQYIAEQVRDAAIAVGGRYRWMNYGDWRLGKFASKNPLGLPLNKYESDAEDYMREHLSGIQTYYRNRSDFGPEQLEREIYKIQGEVELIGLDHVHYVDYDGPDENAEMKAIMKRLKTVVNTIRVPILAIAHLRKNSMASLVPELADFHGSSDIGKIATSAIMLAPASRIITTHSELRGIPTFIRIVKHRLEGSRMNHTAVTFFDNLINQYRPNYVLGELNFSSDKWTSLAGDLPTWATNGLNIDLGEIGGK